jgi:hypothetical protein
LGPGKVGIGEIPLAYLPLRVLRTERHAP